MLKAEPRAAPERQAATAQSVSAHRVAKAGLTSWSTSHARKSTSRPPRGAI
eukprot:CAMPEP_0185452042 /NCGR_PEP_ID=MMETSP1365-20130426/66175_1 /TAXON_ID=38817 /ORGANISM="Gephyrocapsa oceanica, Strain RCC1303" /LENGTH=50 /DNA_ID=CAMNT_0028058215 /DNA_START=46 /DNA_END=195 /DNA_ORIENTATION=+